MDGEAFEVWLSAVAELTDQQRSEGFRALALAEARRKEPVAADAGIMPCSASGSAELARPGPRLPEAEPVTAAGAAIFAALTAGLGIALWQTRVADAQRTIADREATHARAEAAKAITEALGEKPNRLIFSGKANTLTPEEEIIKSSKPLPAKKPFAPSRNI